jgi:hypothetical protein
MDTLCSLIVPTPGVRVTHPYPTLRITSRVNTEKKVRGNLKDKTTLLHVNLAYQTIRDMDIGNNNAQISRGTVTFVVLPILVIYCFKCKTFLPLELLMAEFSALVFTNGRSLPTTTPFAECCCAMVRIRGAYCGSARGDVWR